MIGIFSQNFLFVFSLVFPIIPLFPYFVFFHLATGKGGRWEEERERIKKKIRKPRKFLF